MRGANIKRDCPLWFCFWHTRKCLIRKVGESLFESVLEVDQANPPKDAAGAELL